MKDEILPGEMEVKTITINSQSVYSKKQNGNVVKKGLPQGLP